MTPLSVAPLVGTVVVTAFCQALVRRQLAAVRTNPSSGASDLILKLKRATAETRLEVAAKHSLETTWEGRLVRALERDPSEAERVDAVSEAVNDVALLYASRSRWGAAALRIQLLGGLMMGAWAFIAGDIPIAVASVALGIAGAALFSGLVKAATAAEKEQRKRVDTLVDLLLPNRAGPAHSSNRWKEW